MHLGFLLENIMEGARHLNYTAQYEILSNSLGMDHPCARVLLTRENSLAPYDITHVMKRNTLCPLIFQGEAPDRKP